VIFLAKKEKRGFGSWAFLIGFILAILFGVMGVTDSIAWLLIVFGLVVGFMNILKSSMLRIELNQILFPSNYVLLK